MAEIPNIGKFPKPGLDNGKRAISSKLTKKNAEVKSLLERQTYMGNIPSGSLLKSASQNIILDSYMLNAFFEKIASSFIKPIKATIQKSSPQTMPETRQFMDYASAGATQKTIVQNPIQRSTTNVGHPQPIFPDKSI